MLIQQNQQKQQQFKRQISQNQQSIETDNMQALMRMKSRQFVLDCGIILAKQSNENSKISLVWHKNNTNNFEEFVESVRGLTLIADMDLTSSDISKLQVEYNKID